jgi:hypothetical protein
MELLRVNVNSSAVEPFEPGFAITYGCLRLHRDPLQAWASALRSGTQAI